MQRTGHLKNLPVLWQTSSLFEHVDVLGVNSEQAPLVVEQLRKMMHNNRLMTLTWPYPLDKIVKKSGRFLCVLSLEANKGSHVMLGHWALAAVLPLYNPQR
jgi:hypothetical protein